ncbi:MAG: hypothetical protein OCC45_12500 [Desulfotalea sp.]
MKKIAEHRILLKASAFKYACRQIMSYFERSRIVLYDSTHIIEEQSYPASQPEFMISMNQAIDKNKVSIRKLIKNLEDLGIKKISDLQDIEQGYPSKTLHLLTHFSDGFIGVDSSFYNLVDDSHSVPKATLKDINEAPDTYWIICLDAFSTTPERANIIPMHSRN